MSEKKNYYDVLGIRPTARQGEIELAFKGRRTQYHPDKYADADLDTQKWATANMQEINEAYTVLCDADKRQRYDAMLDASAGGTGSHAQSGTKSRGDWSTFKPRGAQKRDAAGASAQRQDSFDDLGTRVARIQRQLAIDFQNAKSDLVDDQCEKGPIEADDAFVIDLMSFTSRECTKLVSQTLRSLEFVGRYSEINTAIGCAQYLVAVLSFHSMSTLPPSFIDGMGRDFHNLQGFVLRQFELVLDEFCRRESDLHLELRATNELVMSVLAGIIGVPQHRPLQVELNCSRTAFIEGFLGSGPFWVSAETTVELLREAEGVGRKLTEMVAQAMASEGTDQRGEDTHCHVASGDEPFLPNYLKDLELDRNDRDRFHFGADISPKKLAKSLAGRRFASANPPKNVYLLVDDTVFQGGADGLIITDEVISFREMFSDSTDYHYRSGWNGGFNASSKQITRFGDSCINFTLVSATAVQSLVWVLNRYFADRRTWCEARAHAGEVQAQFFMSLSCSDDRAAELRWLTMAAESGHPSAQHNLGMHYLEREPERAWQWFTKAARQGNIRSQEVLRRDVFSKFQ
ncbi:J domain-containing protein [Paraburkholderia domus]|uniref:J domain-containing protein n=1 Tax=Paraburkholderia domus TaxID=2793075 RepID=UPI001B15EC69|nr:DnaJ domain-containing protein [Paraburkholderia domus]CAE6768273.1 Chaperone protein DnaJ [Paraburkholderia domus]